MDLGTTFSLSKDYYFERYAWKTPLIPHFDPPSDLEMVVVIPAYKESQLDLAVHSLLACSEVACRVILLIVINAPEQSSLDDLNLNQRAYEEIKQIKGTDQITIQVVNIGLPQKKAGVGLARKIGLDEAVRWFKKLNHSGILVCFDGDCRCSDTYLSAIYSAYKNQNLNAGILAYEHPLDLESGIIPYELGLRYYTDSLRYSGYPNVHQTLGSCITINSDHYCKHGGMNTKKAGEDFYFLNKIVRKPGFAEINEALVYPAARISDRVPFGTGRALIGYQVDKENIISTYNPLIFEDIKIFMTSLPEIIQGQSPNFPTAIQKFLNAVDFYQKLDKLLKNCRNLTSFYKQFYDWFDYFMILKMIHFSRDHVHTNIPLEAGLNHLNETYWKIDSFNTLTPKDQLIKIRALNRSGETSL
ncbi:MAG: hypothetical protein HOK17_10565 [Flammeovirgaceae bacterium]|jgi:hypothetical protein|nr:hypothetical protein [Flammeovirgaceae bacterium]